jgi:tetratricopeptide (TPR) repeat protein
MIVRDESQVIERCLDSVLPWIDSWAIVDTGSVDSTVSLIQKKLSHLPGKIVVQNWTDDFAYHRNHALVAARTVAQISASLGESSALFIDADEHLRVTCSADFDASIQSGDVIAWWTDDNGWRSKKYGLVPLELSILWQGQIHEQLHITNSSVPYAPIQSAHIIYGSDGARRRRTNAYEHDLQMLSDKIESCVQKQYTQLFYKGRTLEALERFDAAAVAFREAADVALDRPDEHWQSLWGMARALDQANRLPEAREAYRSAYFFDQSRAEPLLGLARFASAQGQYNEALTLSNAALALPEPSNTAMFDSSAYGWRAVDLYASAALELELREDLEYALAAYRRLRSANRIPSHKSEHIEWNISVIQKTLASY